jgi:putative MFS transporter
LNEPPSPTPIFTDTHKIGGRLAGAPLTGLHLAVVALCACGFAVDLMELALGSALSAVFSAPPHRLPQLQLSWLLAAVYAGAIVGAPAVGWLGDRVGARLALAGALVWLGASSLLAALSPTVGQLIVWRFLSGVALGAYPPLMIAYLADIFPPGRRGIIIFAVSAAAYLAPPAVIFAVRWLTPLHPFGVDGWRWPLYAAGISCLLIGPGFLWLPEGPGWLLAKSRLAAAATVGDPFARSSAVSGRGASRPERPTAGAAGRRGHADSRLIWLSLIYFLIPWATVAFPLLTGPLLLARHFDLANTLFYVGIAALGPAVGTLLSGLVVDRFTRRAFMTCSAILMLAAVVVFFSASAPIVLGVSVISFGVASALYLPTMTIYGAELFGADVRGRATTAAWAINRIAAATAPALLLPLLRANHVVAVGLVVAGALVASILVLMLLAPRPLDAG